MFYNFQIVLQYIYYLNVLINRKCDKSTSGHSNNFQRLQPYIVLKLNKNNIGDRESSIGLIYNIYILISYYDVNYLILALLRIAYISDFSVN